MAMEETNERDQQNKEYNQELPEGGHGRQKIFWNTDKMHVEAVADLHGE